MTQNNAVTDKHLIAAGRIVAEMMMHVGRGQVAGQLRFNAQVRDALAAGADHDVTHDAFLETYEMFVAATAQSLANGGLDASIWTGKIRPEVVNYCVQMGFDAQDAAQNEAMAGKVTHAQLRAAMAKIRDAKCPSGPNRQGAGYTCPDN